MTEPKLIIGTPFQRNAEGEMVAPFGLFYGDDGYSESTVTVSLSVESAKGNPKIVRRPLALESFYELREAVNDLYDHIRQETP